MIALFPKSGINRIQKSIVLFLLCTQAPLQAQLVNEGSVFNTATQPPSGYSSFGQYTDLAQRFTTANSSDLTLRRIEFDLTTTELTPLNFNNEIHVSIYSDANGFPNQSFASMVSAGLVLGFSHYVLYGDVQLLPNTSYWVRFEVPKIYGLSPACAIPIGQLGVGSGAWFGPDDKSATYAVDWGASYNMEWVPYYSPPIQMIISTAIPEPTVSYLLVLAVVAYLQQKRVLASDNKKSRYVAGSPLVNSFRHVTKRLTPS